MNMNHLICPICHTPLRLSENGRSFICKKDMKPHCFDLASAGYVNLDRGHSGGGDSKECVKSRRAFLNLGHYAPISSKINELARCNAKPEILLDAGCGEGYYTASLAREIPAASVIGIDISKPAIEHAAKNAKRNNIENLFYAVSSIFELPFADGSIDCITNIFAPCPEEEFGRVLKRDGVLIIAAAGKKHLMGLKKVLYESVYMNEVRADLPSSAGLTPIDKTTLSYVINLSSSEEIENLFSMTPYYYRTSLSDKAKLASLTSLETEVEIEFSVYRKNG